MRYVCWTTLAAVSWATAGYGQAEPGAGGAAAGAGAAGRGEERREDLKEKQLAAAAVVDPISLPVPGEFFAAIEKVTNPEWPAFFRESMPGGYSNRLQMALVLGGLIADGYVAVGAQDSQHVKNVGREVIALAKALGVSEDIIARGSSIMQFAEDFEWTALREELEATQNEVKSALTEQKDDVLVTLVTLGGWVRGTQIASTVVGKVYSVETAALLRQPGIMRIMKARLDALPQAARDDELVGQLTSLLGELAGTVELKIDEVPDREAVGKIQELSEGMMAVIERKRPAVVAEEPAGPPEGD